MKCILSLVAVASFGSPGAAAAQSTADDKGVAEIPPPVFTVHGSTSIASDYRFRGVSQSDRAMAVQGGTPEQQAIGRWYDSGADAANGVYEHPGDKGDNLYLSGDGAFALAGTPFVAKAHIGHSRGQDGLGPNATAVAPTGAYWDWSLGADAGWKNLTFSVAYIDTDISAREAAYLRPGFSKGQDGTGTIAGSAALVALTAAF